MFDERFARQYRYEPPPEFPLASPYTSIDHHLSGPNRYALTQIRGKPWSVDSAAKHEGPASYLRRTSTPFTFIAHQSFNHPNTRIYVRLLGPCFKTGQWKPFRQHHEHTAQHLRTVRTFETCNSLNSKPLSHADTQARRRPKPRVFAIPQSNPRYGQVAITSQSTCKQDRDYLPQGFLPRVELMLTHHILQNLTRKPRQTAWRQSSASQPFSNPES